MGYQVKLFLVALVILVGSQVWAADLVERHRSQPEPWMKKDNPTELAVVTEISRRCPDPTATYIDILRGVLRRARITSLPAPLKPGELYLKVEITCAPDSRMLYTSNVTARFWAVRPGRSTHSGDARGLYAELHKNAGRSDIRNAVKDVFEQAINGYRKANPPSW